MIEDLAHTIVNAARIHEESYDKSEEMYTKTRRQSAQEAVQDSALDLRVDGLVGILLCSWNDALEWAEAALKPPQNTPLTRLAEECVMESDLFSTKDAEDLDLILNDETHQVWDAAVDAANWYEGEYNAQD